MALSDLILDPSQNTMLVGFEKDAPTLTSVSRASKSVTHPTGMPILVSGRKRPQNSESVSTSLRSSSYFLLTAKGIFFACQQAVKRAAGKKANQQQILF
jgi:hypothetical protein